MPEMSAVDVGFADFVAVLLVETLDSIVASHTSQEERLRALDAAAELTPEEFAATGITDEVLAAMLAQLFPGGEAGTSLAVGGPVPDEEARAELGLELGDGDVDGGRLTEQGVETVQDAVALYLARRQLGAVREVARRGVPRVLVDGGTLRAKVNFTAVRGVPGDEEEEEATSVAETRFDTTRLTRLGTSSLRGNLVAWDSPIKAGVLDSIRNVRLRVAGPAVPDAGEPQDEARTQVFGEVEIRFHTEV